MISTLLISSIIVSSNQDEFEISHALRYTAVISSVLEVILLLAVGSQFPYLRERTLFVYGGILFYILPFFYMLSLMLNPIQPRKHWIGILSVSVITLAIYLGAGIYMSNKFAKNYIETQQKTECDRKDTDAKYREVREQLSECIDARARYLSEEFQRIKQSHEDSANRLGIDLETDPKYKEVREINKYFKPARPASSNK